MKMRLCHRSASLLPVAPLIIAFGLSSQPARGQDNPTPVPTGTCAGGGRPAGPCTPRSPGGDTPPYSGPSPEEIAKQKRLEVAHDLNVRGVNRYEANDYDSAILLFEEALANNPDDATIKQNLANAQHAKRQKDEEEKKADWNRKKAEAVSNLQGISSGDLGLSGFGDDNSVGLMGLSPPKTIGNHEGHYSVFHEPPPPGSSARIVLDLRQPDIKELDAKLKRARNVLRQLMAANNANEAAREEWAADSMEASEEAERLSLTLLLDLIDVHVDHLADANSGDRRQILNDLLNQPVGPRKDRLHNLYGMLLNRRRELQRIHGEVDLAERSNDIRQRLANLKAADDSTLTVEDVHDFISSELQLYQMYSGIDLDPTGPTQDLADAARVIIEQGMSLYHLSQIQGREEASSESVNRLMRYIAALEEQKQSVATKAPPK